MKDVADHEATGRGGPISVNVPTTDLPSLVDWAKSINAFATNEIEHYKTTISSYLTKLTNLKSFEQEVRKLQWDIVGGYEHAQPGSRLGQCGMGVLPGSPAPANPGVVYAAYLANGKPCRISERVANWLKSSGVNKVIVGHQPNGDAPFVLEDFGVQVSHPFEMLITLYLKFLYSITKDDQWRQQLL